MLRKHGELLSIGKWRKKEESGLAGCCKLYLWYVLMSCNRCWGNVRVRGVDVELVDVVELRKLSCKTKDTQTKHKRQRKLAKRKWGQTVKMAGDSGCYSAETPVGADTPVDTRRILRCRAARGSSCSWRKSDFPNLKFAGIWQNWAKGTRRKLDHALRQVLHGSKPQKTHQIRRSIRKAKFWLFFGIFESMVENNNQAQIRGNLEAAHTIW